MVKKEKKRKNIRSAKKKRKENKRMGEIAKTEKNTTNKIIKSMPMITNNKSRKGAIEKKVNSA